VVIITALARTSNVVVVAVAALLAVLDVALWLTDPVVNTGRISISIAFLVPCLGVLATAAVATRRRHVSVALIVLSVSSVLLTIICAAIGTGLPPSFAALFTLAVLSVGVLRYLPSDTATLLSAAAVVAVATESLRPMVSAAAYLLVVCEGALGVAIGVGVYLRWTDWQRSIAQESARVDERLEIARELHDLVGHYVTGMVVQAQAALHVSER
jgi:signal transduction histidine kinase